MEDISGYLRGLLAIQEIELSISSFENTINISVWAKLLQFYKLYSFCYFEFHCSILMASIRFIFWYILVS